MTRSVDSPVNKGESRNGLARAVFIHRLGEIRDCTYENQQHRASGLSLLVTAIILWNTRYLNRAIAALREAEDIPDHLLAHLSPLGWEHVNLTGDYIWAPGDHLTENADGYRPLRITPDAALVAAQVPDLSAYATKRGHPLVLARSAATNTTRSRTDSQRVRRIVLFASKSRVY